MSFDNEVNEEVAKAGRYMKGAGRNQHGQRSFPLLKFDVRIYAIAPTIS